MQVIRTIDAHVGGQPLRLIVDGAPRVLGRTMAHKRDAMRRAGDALRRAVLLEPRGHADMTAAILTEPVTPGADAGLLVMHGDGFVPLSGHAIIAATTIALERGLIVAASDTLVFDTIAGAVQAHALVQRHGDRARVGSVAVTGVPSFVVAPGQPVRLGSRELRVDVAYGGVFYAIVDTEAIGIPLDGPRLPELRRLGVDIRESLNAAARIAHPADATRSGVGGVIFTGPPRDPEAHLRNVTVFGAGAVNRSPGGTVTAAVMAVLEAMGLLPDDQSFVFEGPAGALFHGRVARRTLVAGAPAIVPRIEGSAWITGEHTFFVDEDDPLRDGFVL